MNVYFFILIGFFVVSALSTWAIDHYFKGSIAKHIVGVGIIGSMLYDGYLILFVPYEGFQDIVRLLTLYALVAALVGYGGAVLWLNRKKRTVNK